MSSKGLSREILCKRIKQSDGSWTFCGHMIFRYGKVGVVLPHQLKMTKCLPIRVVPPTNILHPHQNGLNPPLLLPEMKHQNLKTMNVCCRQKTFSTSTKNLDIPLQLGAMYPLPTDQTTIDIPGWRTRLLSHAKSLLFLKKLTHIQKSAS